jgi:rhamnogalacturonan endolyase
MPSSRRGTFKGAITLPKRATRAIAVLALNGADFQDNNKDGKAYQYWGEIDSSGSFTISSVKAGTYRLTVYADGIFGQYTQDGIEIKAGETQTTTLTWTDEAAGTELWRIGTPDKSCGEFRHGDEKDTSKSLGIRQYRQYWAVHDFPNDFPNGVKYKVGTSDPAKDFNYVHWSVFGGKANYVRKDPYYTNVNNWTLTFDLTQQQIADKANATFTIQLAGVKTSAGNNDNANKDWNNLPYTVVVNGKQLPTWTIPSQHSSSCVVRSVATCYTTGHKFVFEAGLLGAGGNEMILSLPARATAPEDAVLPESVYLQYDALRLEVV